MENYDVAVIVPTLNEELFIERCLRSLKEQTFPFQRMDVMIVDGGSTDQTCNIAMQIATACPNVRLIHNPKRYQSAAFNIGVNASTAPFIVRLDAHTEYDTHYIERCMTLLRSHPDYGNVGGICQIRPGADTRMAEAVALLNKLRFGIGGADFRVGTKACETDSVPFGAFRRSVILQVGGMREDLARGEDNEFNSRIRKAGYKVYMDPDIKSAYYARPTLTASCRQMYQNGVSIGRLLHIDRQAVGFRHLVPFAFVSSLAICLIAALFTRLALYLLAAILAAYAAAALAADISACRKYGSRFFFLLPVLFFCVHVSYGAGTIAGISGKKH